MSEEKQQDKPDAGKVFLEELTQPQQAPDNETWWRRLGRLTLIPTLAIVTGLIVGALFIVATSVDVYEAFGMSFWQGITTSWDTVTTAYSALLMGSLGDPRAMVEAVQSGDPLAIRRAFNPISDSLTLSVPLMLAGLGVALGFRAGLFNIGAEGQLFVGAIFAAFVGFQFTNLPAIIHIPLAVAAGAIGGGIWGFIPGWLKAKTGGHEVINTIMLNYIAFRLTEWLLRGPMRGDNPNPISPPIAESARLPRFFEAPLRFHLGFFLALALAWFVWWFLFKTNWGFQLRTVGANPNAARYAGMNIVNVTVLAMTLSGALAGLAGTNEVLGVNYNLALAFSSGTGFDAIAIALLGKNHPIGVVLAAILFGVLRGGATRMDVASGIGVDIISILQALILVFIAAPAIVRTIYRLRGGDRSDAELVTVNTWSN